MADSESYRAGSGITEPSLPGMPRVVTTQRTVPPETPLPVRGQTLGDAWEAYSGFFVVDAQDIQKGGLRTHVVSCVSPAPWTVLNGSTRDRQLNAAIVYRQQVVPTPTEAAIAADPNSEYTPINEALSIKRTTVAPTVALNAYYVPMPSRVNLDIPDVLTAITVDWNEDSGTGGFNTTLDVGVDPRPDYSLSTSQSGSAHSSAGFVPSIRPTVREYNGRNLRSTTHFFFLPIPVTDAAILSALSAKGGITASLWPVFKPESVTITLKASKKSVQSRVSGEASQTHFDEGDRILVQVGEGDGYDISLSSGSETIRPTIHGAISLSGTLTKTTTITAESEINWSGTNFPTVSKTKTASASVSSSVSPSSIPATSPAAVPTSGIYLVDSKVDVYDFGYAMVAAETINASILS